MISLGVVVALFGVVWWLESVPPDDPWMLEHGHRLAHHYGAGMGPGSADHALQEAAARKAAERDARIAAIRLEHITEGARIALDA